MIIGIYNSVSSANNAIDDLTAMGYSIDDITVITREDVVRGDVNIENDTTEGVKDGAKTGGVIGGVLGLLTGLGALAIPGVGALFIAGPIATALGLTGVAGATATGALTGALAGGLIAGLKEIGLDEVKARRYEQAIKDGSILVGVVVNTNKEEEIENTMAHHEAQDVSVLDVR